MEDGEWNVRFQFLLRIENTPNLWFGVFEAVEKLRFSSSLSIETTLSIES